MNVNLISITPDAEKTMAHIAQTTTRQSKLCRVVEILYQT